MGGGGRGGLYEWGEWGGGGGMGGGDLRPPSPGPVICKSHEL